MSVPTKRKSKVGKDTKKEEKGRRYRSPAAILALSFAIPRKFS